MSAETHHTEPALPDMPDPEPLWAVHVQGPDDIVAVASREAAEADVEALNGWYADRQKQVDYDPATFPRIHAEVIPWPHSREAHAEALLNQAED